MTLTGSGLLIIYNDHDSGRNRIILFREKRGYYSDAGGTIDNNEKPFETAIRETREESRNLFNPEQFINKNKNQFIDILKEESIYRLYVVYIDINKTQLKSLKNMYKKNMEYISKHKNFPLCWNETDNIATFDLQKCVDFMKQQDTIYEKRPLIYLNRNGKKYLIRKRPVKSLLMLVKNPLFDKIIKNKRKIELVENNIGTSINIL